MIKRLAWAGLGLGYLAGCAGQPLPVSVEQSSDRVVVAFAGQPFAVYNWGSRSKPFFFPIYGPGGVSMTRQFPMVEGVAGERPDHPHHTGLYFAHGAVNGIDLWHGKGPRGGSIRQDEIEVQAGRGPGQAGQILTRNSYLDPAGKRICGERRRMSFSADDQGRYLDLDIEIHADAGPVTLGDTKEGTLALRLPAQLRLRGPVAKGRALTSTGRQGAKGWGTRGRWAAYAGPAAVSGAAAEREIGVAILDHPQNHAHPTRWVIRAYGLFAANPFGLSDFEKAPKGSGALRIPAGGQERFRYRIWFFSGGLDVARLDAGYARYVESSASSSR